jgi:hypothetical protein
VLKEELVTVMQLMGATDAERIDPSSIRDRDVGRG